MLCHLGFALGRPTLPTGHGVYEILSQTATIGTCFSDLHLIIFHLHFHRKLKHLFFLFWGGGGVNFLMQLQFLAPVELFFN